MTKYVQDTYENDFNLEFTYHMHLNLTLIDKNEEILHNADCILLELKSWILVRQGRFLVEVMDFLTFMHFDSS